MSGFGVTNGGLYPPSSLSKQSGAASLNLAEVFRSDISVATGMPVTSPAALETADLAGCFTSLRPAEVGRLPAATTVVVSGVIFPFADLVFRLTTAPGNAAFAGPGAHSALVDAAPTVAVAGLPETTALCLLPGVNTEVAGAFPSGIAPNGVETTASPVSKLPDGCSALGNCLPITSSLPGRAGSWYDFPGEAATELSYGRKKSGWVLARLSVAI